MPAKPKTFSASDHKNATPSGTFSFATPPNTGSGLFRGTSLFGESATSGTASSAAPATGTLGGNIFGSTAPRAGSPFGVTNSLFGQPKSGSSFGATPAVASPPRVTTGTSTPTYSATLTTEDSGMRANSVFSAITAMPAYQSTSIEELRVQDYQHDHKTASATNQTSSGAFAFAMSTTSLFGTPALTQSTTGLAFGGGTNSAFGLSTRGSECAKPPTAGTVFGSVNTTGQPGSALNPGKLQRIEELLRKSLLGEEVVNTQFHLFSAKSLSGRVVKPRVLCANSVILAESSKYFLQLLGSDIDPSDPSLIDLSSDNDVPSDALIDEYGYESDSDLDDCDDPISAANPGASKAESTTSPRRASAKSRLKDYNELSEDGFEPIGSGALVVGSRHILVKDTAFRTWYTLLNYLYTGKFSFLPLSSTIPAGARGSSTSSLDVPKCSAKSMYRLACKVGLDHLRYVTLAHIRSNLTEHNILTEISRSLVSKHPEILEMELDILYSHIASPPVVANFAAVAQRIAQNKLPHGADIMVGIYTRLLKERHPFGLEPAASTPLPGPLAPPALAKPDVGTSNVPVTEVKDKTGASRVDGRGTPSISLPSGNGQSTPNMLTPASAKKAASTATSTRDPDAEGKQKVTEKSK